MTLPLNLSQLPRAALADWIDLLQGPASPIFSLNSDFKSEWGRLFRLLSLTLSMTGAILVVFSIVQGDWRTYANQMPYTLITLVIGAVLGVPYAFIIAPLMRIKIGFVPTFFSVLLLGLPWVPLFALVWAFGKAFAPPDGSNSLTGFYVSIFFLILSFAVIYNFCRAVSIIAGCKFWRSLTSLLVPLLLLLIIKLMSIKIW
jgi:hypothetical protein